MQNRTILSTLLPGQLQDVVAVYTQDFVQVFRDARAIKVVVKEDSKAMEHPVESGAIITDHRIILPAEIEFSMVLTSSTYSDTYRQIAQYYRQGTLLIVQTKTREYRNQLITSIPHEENPDFFNEITLALKSKQVLIAVPQFGTIPRRPKNTSTVQRGVQQPQQPTSIGYDISQGTAKYFGASKASSGTNLSLSQVK